MFATSREEFKDRCLRDLGFPVIEINVDEDQVADRIDDALKKYWEVHHDGVEKLYYKHQVTAADIANNYITLPDRVIGVTRVFPFENTFGATSGNVFDARYQFMLNNLETFESLSYVDYEITMMHLEHLNFFFNGVPGLRFNAKQHRVYLDIDWQFDIQADQYIIIEAVGILDPDVYNAIWQDDWLFRYATALIKRQWGANMKKFSGVQLPGGIVLNGQQIYDEAIGEIAALLAELRDTYEEPPMFRLG
jgi:hypothetical protein